MDDTITLVSTTDSPEDVQAALTGQPPAAAAPAAEPPAESAEKAPAQAAAAEPQPGDQAAAPKAGETPAEKAAGASKGERRLQSIEKEIAVLTREKHDLRRDNEAEIARAEQVKREIAELEAKKAELTSAPPAKPAESPVVPVTETQATVKALEDQMAALGPRPKLDDTNQDGTPTFANYEAWVDAGDTWTDKRNELRVAVAEAKADAAIDAKLKAKETTERARIERESVTRAQQDILAKYAERLEVFKQSHADFDAVLDAVKDEKTTAMIDAHILNSERGPEVYFYLAQHPDELRRIAALSEARQLVQLGMIEARLEAAASGPSSVVAPTTKAPAPIRPVGSGPTASTVSPEDEDWRSYADRRNREERARAGTR